MSLSDCFSLGLNVKLLGAVVRSVACPLLNHWFRDRPPPSAQYFVESFSSSVASRRTSCQLLRKEWTLNTGILTPGGWPRNKVIK